MNTLGFVLRSAGRASLLLAAVGALGAAFNAGLIAVVHRALEGAGDRRLLALAFLGLGLGKTLSAYAAGRIAESYSQESLAELRRELIGKLLAVPYRSFEELGAGRAYSALTTDVQSVSAALQSTGNAVANAAVLLGGALYLLYLDVRTFAALLLLSVLAFAVYRVMIDSARALLRKARAEHDRLFGHFQALTEGAKELRLHAPRRRAFLDGPLLETTEALLDYGLAGNARYLLGQAVNGLLVLCAIGVVLFAFADDEGGAVASGYVLTGLYLTGPLASLLRLVPLYAGAEIALARVQELGIRLGSRDGEPGADAAARPSFAAIELRQVTYRYDERTSFMLGPLTLRIEPAQILIIAGGNGSGKSTLAKLLVGLYEPFAGELSWNGRQVGAERRDLYRQLFSAVFSEFYLFDRLYGLDAEGLDARARTLIADLGLAGTVSVEDGSLSSIELSRGQRKRLALLTALLEDRPIYVFDEWAADQDTDFKQVFYRRLLPELKQRGKAVIVITHDDRYFDVADRVITLDAGKIVEHEAAGGAGPHEVG